MPLKPGKAAIGSNIVELHTGKVHAKTQAKHGKAVADSQSIAIAMKTARQSRKPNPKHNATSSDWYWGK